MHDLRVQFALDNFIEEDYFLPMKDCYQLKEEKEPYYDEWEKECMYLNFGEELKISHKRIKMKRNEVTGVLEGMLEIG